MNYAMVVHHSDLQRGAFTSKVWCVSRQEVYPQPSLYKQLKITIPVVFYFYRCLCDSQISHSSQIIRYSGDIRWKLFPQFCMTKLRIGMVEALKQLFLPRKKNIATLTPHFIAHLEVRQAISYLLTPKLARELFIYPSFFLPHSELLGCKRSNKCSQGTPTPGSREEDCSH